MVAEQLALFEVEEVPKKVYYKRIVHILKDYPQLKKALETEKALAEAGIGLEELFPSITASYHGAEEEDVRPMTPDEYEREKLNYNSKTEQYAIKRAEIREAAARRMKVKQMKVLLIERALDALNAEQRKIIQMKYIDRPEMSDIQVMQELNMGRTLYYDTKDLAVRMIATVLNIL
jgi:ArpU family phage transcriptional regulator